jgi:hypothetical protein
MSKQIGTPPGVPIREGKYARVERQRRFLLAGPPPVSAVTTSRRITDWYVPGMRLRVRCLECLDSGASSSSSPRRCPPAAQAMSRH